MFQSVVGHLCVSRENLLMLEAIGNSWVWIRVVLGAA